MKPLHIVTVCLLYLFTSCCPKLYSPNKEEYTKIEYRDSIIHDSVLVEVPLIVEKVVTRDTLSHLENDWAESDASYSEGLLSHTLKTKPQKISVPVSVVIKGARIERVDSIVKTVYIERELTKWQTIQMWGFWICLAVIALFILLLKR